MEGRESLMESTAVAELIRRPVTMGRGELRDRELYRYLGLKQGEVSGEMEAAVEEHLRELLSLVKIRQVAELLPLTVAEGEITLGGLNIHSKALAKNLRGTTHALIFAMTLGTAVDRRIHSLSRLRPASAFMVDQMATEVLEGACNKWLRAIGREARALGYELRPRFSPGFADFSLDHQEEILELLRAKSRIHLAITEGKMLVPTKSITALAGFLPAPSHKEEI
ncbi:MAG: hypothetical protein Q4E76_03455 [Tissierellia bacterium]|nr:hypothetical protein [Tissierellia bacterium]